MNAFKKRSKLMAALVTGAAISLTIAGCSTGGATTDGKVELSLLVDNTDANIATVEALAEAFTAQNPDIEIDVQTRPGGEEGDNLIKTRLATGEMTDLFWYNSGSLMQALNPDQTLLNIADEPFMDAVTSTFIDGVSTPNGVYAVPAGTGMGGGILYNEAIYAELGLEVPVTWDEFMDNNEAISNAGYDAVVQTYTDAWTSQLFVLGDFYNVLAEEPNWADDYTANKVNYADDDVAIRGFERLQEVYEAGYLNEDFASSTLDDGLRMLAQGEGAHYPMLSFAVSTIVELYPDQADDIGFFAQPGDGPSNGLTTWLANGIYAPADTEHPDEVKSFMAFIATVEACDVQSDAVGATGPYFIEGCVLPDDVPNATADLLPYFETEGGTAAALEFLSPVKGPSLPQITVEVGSGIRSAAEGASLYDQDVTKQAQQLGLEGW
ncbi:carbohydrate ABC transporter substrate-binding protein [Salinibacterium sp. UTAS2018]|uniref:ABC transporter substrate-binding protein n=1 Tax=Salinibacterium sp. UTAS2018 TaxID=2508880 RepID=UPI00100957A1|nr:ABC transporter substrate-binding protein [Salinibacterium sp. UTAS2018]QAV70871.1 carbohydrate ABC transporter substrate-binding protein [Salinibacterium sp. UTAS2018]